MDLTKKIVRKVLGLKEPNHWQRSSIIGLLSLFFMLATSAISLTAYEAHIINVLARIEPREYQCDALSQGYWKNHEGCSRGNGESNWTPEINTLSADYSGVFSQYSGADICKNLYIPDCPNGNNVPSRLCKAKAHTLTDELNVVSGHLDLSAILAGADDGSDAFDNLGLSAESTVKEALIAIETILADPNHTTAMLTDADHVAERIYTFYEDENVLFPQCLYYYGNISSTPLILQSLPETTLIDDEEKKPVVEEPAVEEPVDEELVVEEPVVEEPVDEEPVVEEPVVEEPVVEEPVVEEPVVEESLDSIQDVPPSAEEPPAIS